MTTKERYTIENTSRIGDCLEQGGVCGRVVSWPANAIAEALGVDISELENITAGMTPEQLGQQPSIIEGVSVRAYLERNHIGNVIRRGTTIR